MGKITKSHFEPFYGSNHFEPFYVQLPSREVEQLVGFRNLEFKEEVQARDRNLEVARLWMKSYRECT